jgi:nicotinic acid mononucleotide adenylyltransferase
VVAVGAYPGTFNPPTVAHLAIAEAAWRQGRLDRVDLVVSRTPLGKDLGQPPLPRRMTVLETIATTRPWLGVRLTDQQLIADVVAGYDAVVLGSDKWAQINDPVWYRGSAAARDATLARLPRLLLVPRPPLAVPSNLPSDALILAVDSHHGSVSSTEARAGRLEWMAPEAAAAGWWDPGCHDRGNPTN